MRRECRGVGLSRKTLPCGAHAKRHYQNFLYINNKTFVSSKFSLNLKIFK